jgi:hypothetical protein
MGSIMESTMGNIMVHTARRNDIAFGAIRNALNLCHIICHRLPISTKVL